MHDRPHLPMSPAEAASLRSSSPVDEALLQRIRAALVGKDTAGGASDAAPDAATQEDATQQDSAQQAVAGQDATEQDTSPQAASLQAPAEQDAAAPQADEDAAPE